MKPSLMVRLVRKKQIKDNQVHFAAKDLDYEVEEHKDLNYCGDGNPLHNLDIYSPVGARGELPTVLMIHGGGYISCEKFINEAQGKFFATQGFRVVNINYSLQPEADFIQVMQEIFSALHWIDANATEYGFNREKIFVSGDSAGGHYSLLVAAIQTSPILQGYYGVKPLAQGVKGFAASCPMTQIRSAKEKNDLTNRFLRKNLLHSGRLADDQYIDNVSLPYLLDKCQFPEVFILTTPTDEVMYEETRAFHQTLVDKGIVHQWREYQGKDRDLCHAFNVVDPEEPESIQANQEILSYFQSR